MTVQRVFPGLGFVETLICDCHDLLQKIADVLPRFHSSSPSSSVQTASVVDHGVGYVREAMAHQPPDALLLLTRILVVTDPLTVHYSAVEYFVQIGSEIDEEPTKMLTISERKDLSFPLF